VLLFKPNLINSVTWSTLVEGGKEKHQPCFCTTLNSTWHAFRSHTLAAILASFWPNSVAELLKFHSTITLVQEADDGDEIVSSPLSISQVTPKTLRKFKQPSMGLQLHATQALSKVSSYLLKFDAA